MTADEGATSRRTDPRQMKALGTFLDSPRGRTRLWEVVRQTVIQMAVEEMDEMTRRERSRS